MSQESNIIQSCGDLKMWLNIIYKCINYTFISFHKNKYSDKYTDLRQLIHLY